MQRRHWHEVGRCQQTRSFCPTVLLTICQDVLEGRSLTRVDDVVVAGADVSRPTVVTFAPGRADEDQVDCRPVALVGLDGHYRCCWTIGQLCCWSTSVHTLKVKDRAVLKRQVTMMIIIALKWLARGTLLISPSPCVNCLCLLLLPQLLVNTCVSYRETVAAGVQQWANTQEHSCPLATDTAAHVAASLPLLAMDNLR